MRLTANSKLFYMHDSASQLARVEHETLKVKGVCVCVCVFVCVCVCAYPPSQNYRASSAIWDHTGECARRP